MKHLVGTMHGVVILFNELFTASLRSWGAMLPSHTQLGCPSEGC